MKKFMLFVISIFFASMLIVYFKPYSVISNNVTQTKYISQNTVEQFQSNSSSALKEIISITLDNLKLWEWKESSTLNPLIFFEDVYPEGDKEMVVAISLGKDRGLLAVYKKTAEGYSFVGSINNLAPIKNLTFLALPGLQQKAIVVEDYLNEMLGAFYKVKTMGIYAWHNENFIKLWEREIMREEYYPENLQLQGAKTQWLMKKEVVRVSFSQNGDIEVNGQVSISKNKTLGEINGDYQILTSEKIHERYIWLKDKLAYKRMFTVEW